MPGAALGPGGHNEEPGRTGLSLRKVGFHGETQETEETGKMRRQAKSKGRVASRRWAASPKEVTPRARPRDAPAGKVLEHPGPAGAAAAGVDGERPGPSGGGGLSALGRGFRRRAGGGLHRDPSRRPGTGRGQVLTRGRLGCVLKKPTGGEGKSEPRPARGQSSEVSPAPRCSE